MRPRQRPSKVRRHIGQFGGWVIGEIFYMVDPNRGRLRRRTTRSQRVGLFLAVFRARSSSTRTQHMYPFDPDLEDDRRDGEAEPLGEVEQLLKEPEPVPVRVPQEPSYREKETHRRSRLSTCDLFSVCTAAKSRGQCHMVGLSRRMHDQRSCSTTPSSQWAEVRSRRFPR